MLLDSMLLGCMLLGRNLGVFRYRNSNVVPVFASTPRRHRSIRSWPCRLRRYPKLRTFDGCDGRDRNILGTRRDSNLLAFFIPKNKAN